MILLYYYAETKEIIFKSVNLEGLRATDSIMWIGLKATSHLCVERERPLRITCSIYFENIMNYYLYLKHVREGE